MTKIFNAVLSFMLVHIENISEYRICTSFYNFNPERDQRQTSHFIKDMFEKRKKN